MTGNDISRALFPPTGDVFGYFDEPNVPTGAVHIQIFCIYHGVLLLLFNIHFEIGIRKLAWFTRSYNAQIISVHVFAA